ncbi:MAG: hypothetical protein PT977_15870, partial [Acidobacteriota bacterium]|nr:hypothetical protein [Acidobacteriota bacterium]
NGRNNTFFRTDGRFYNPGSTDATVSVAFHASQNTNPAPLTATFTVPAGKIRDVVDVLDSLLGLPVGSAGALRFKSDAFVAILCRTSNVDPAGVNPGTFGAQQKPRQLLSFLMSADAGAVVTGIRQNPTFRTNVGFAAGGDGAAYSLTLKSASGATVATATGSLGAFGWTQPNVQDLFPSVTIPNDATLLVRVTSGSVDVFDSSIDNASGDPVVTPVMPLPAEIPSSATIGPAGGTIRSVDGVLTLKVPAGALSAPVSIGLALAPNDAPGGVGSGYDISPEGLAFAKPALLRFTYGPGGLDIPGIDGIAVAFPIGTSWGGLTGGRIDTSARTLTIGLPNTSPSPPSLLTAGRVPNAKSGGSRIVALRGLEIHFGSGRGWVPTDDELFLIPIFRLPPAGTGERPITATISDLFLDPIRFTFSPPNIGTIRPGSTADVFSYTAPHSIGHASLPVTIRLKALIPLPPGLPSAFALYEATTILHVVRRKWTVKAEFKMDTGGCGGGKSHAYSYSDLQNLDFVLDSSLNLNAVSTLGRLPADAVLTSCECTATLLGRPGNMTFTGAGGNLHVGPPAIFYLKGTVEIPDMMPGVSLKCPPDGGGTVAPISFTLFLPLLMAVPGGLRPSDARPRFIALYPELTIIMDWYSIAE